MSEKKDRDREIVFSRVPAVTNDKIDKIISLCGYKRGEVIILAVDLFYRQVMEDFERAEVEARQQKLFPMGAPFTKLDDLFKPPAGEEGEGNG